MQISFVLGNWCETVDRSRINADNFRESFHNSAKIEDSFFYIDRKAMWTLRRKNVSFSSGDLVSLKVSPIKELMRLGKREKLAPSYLGPFEIRSRVGEVAYRLVLPP